jgi:Protein of unknown function (DUF4242)
LVVRTFTVDEGEMPVVGRRSRLLVEEQFPQITWEHSHVLVDDEGVVRTFCVYAAPDPETVLRHAAALGQHKVDDLQEIAGDVSPADFPG